MENLPQEQRKQRLIQSKPSEKGEIITYLSQMGDVLEQIFEWGKLVPLRIQRIKIIIDGNIPYMVSRKDDFGVGAYFNIVPAESGQVFGDQC